MQITRGIARILLHHLYCLFTLRLQWNKFTINKSLFTILVQSDQNGARTMDRAYPDIGQYSVEFYF